jgi:tRNA threonylcarbamoyladenosine biosynthesis protein TsaB
VVVLALETATDLVGAAVADDRGVRAASWSVGRRRHAESLAPAVEHVCAHAGVALGDLEAVAVDVGPGLFTGLRVGVAMANGLALALGVPVTGLPSVELLAEAVAEGPCRGDLLSVVDARRGQVFLRPYHLGPGGPEPRGETTLASPEALQGAAALAETPLAVGDGALRYRAELEAGGAVVGGPALAFPRPETLARLVGRRSVGDLPAPGRPVTPVYLRAPDVRIGWSERPTVAEAGR